MIQRLPQFKSCHRMGSAGHKQHGIDLSAVDSSGKTWSFSNKKYKRYSPSHARKHIVDVTASSDFFVLLLSCTASPAVRKEIGTLSNWQVWDADDICRRVRELSATDPSLARQLVEHHFGPAWTKAFLGLASSGVFLSLADQYRPFLKARTLFNHRNPLIGRKRECNTIITALRRRKVILLGAVGGAGKSRLLLEIATRCERKLGIAVRFLIDGVLGPNSFDDLPSTPCLIIVDDAHRQADLRQLLAFIRERGNLKTIIATRPQAISRLKSDIRGARFGDEECLYCPTLDPLPGADLKKLVAGALGRNMGKRKDLVQQLARISDHSPLIAVVGANLVRSKQMNPVLFQGDAAFKRVVFDRLVEALLDQKNGPQVSPPWLLPVISAINPLPAFLGRSLFEAIASTSFSTVSEVQLFLCSLEQSGHLVRLGGLLKLTPDLLADHLLTEACILPPSPFGGNFATTVFSAFESICPETVLANLAEVDIRLKIQFPNRPRVLDEIWARLWSRYAKAGGSERKQIILLVQKVSHLKPEWAVALARTIETERDETLYDMIPALLERCDTDIPTLRDSIAILWRLNTFSSIRFDPSPLNVIRGYSKLEHFKPVEVNDVVVSFLMNIVCEGGGFDWRPVAEILAPLLEKSGADSWSEGNKIVTVPFFVSPHAVRSVRAKAFEVASTLLNQNDLECQGAVVKLLTRALHGPLPLMNLKLTDKIRNEWVSDQLHILGILERFFALQRHPVVQSLGLAGIEFERQHAHSSEVKRLAERLGKALEDAPDLRLARLLMPKLYPFADFDREDGKPAGDYVARHRERHFQVLKELRARFKSCDEIVDHVLALHGDITANREEAQIGSLLAYLIELIPEWGADLAWRALRAPYGPLKEVLPSFFAASRQHCASQFYEMVRFTIRSSDSCNQKGLSRFYAFYCREFNRADIDAIRFLASHPLDKVRVAVVPAIAELAKSERHVAIELALSIEIDSEGEILESFFGHIGGGSSFQIDPLEIPGFLVV
ncbi:MAG: hypothetical protein U0744_12395 [Gemmataceae bacterium]